MVLLTSPSALSCRNQMELQDLLQAVVGTAVEGPYLDVIKCFVIVGVNVMCKAQWFWFAPKEEGKRLVKVFRENSTFLWTPRESSPLKSVLHRSQRSKIVNTLYEIHASSRSLCTPETKTTTCRHFHFRKMLRPAPYCPTFARKTIYVVHSRSSIWHHRVPLRLV